jgi:protein-S-isoprenylcysteine O-methyltransferase Ste14
MVPLSVYSWITIAMWCASLVYLVARGRPAQQNVKVYEQQPAFARIFKIAAMLVTFVAIYRPQWLHLQAPSSAPLPLQAAIGVVMCGAGLLLLISSRVALGKNWSDLVVLKQDHELVQSGPYRWIRHPLYSGLILALLGSSLTAGGRGGYTITAVCFVGLFIKSRKEEALLARRLPGYAIYREHVKGFIPFVL